MCVKFNLSLEAEKSTSMESGDILTTPEISLAILQLIEDTREYCFLVSPYYKPWGQLQRALQRAKAKKQPVTVICRADQKEHQIREIIRDQKTNGYELVLVENLHAKLYLSENAAILSSMNLYNSSEAQNIEIGQVLSYYDSQAFLQKVIQDQLLNDPSAKVYPGWFHADMEKKRAEVTTFFEELKGRGFCVTCGKQRGYEESDSLVNPNYRRCMDCWLSTKTLFTRESHESLLLLLRQVLREQLRESNS